MEIKFIEYFAEGNMADVEAMRFWEDLLKSQESIELLIIYLGLKQIYGG